ncbi:MAG TPA: ABC transporter ATP-binding protein, partial [Bacillota bacterium]|nr:ABC transporter ATP-binding protein [Bacillota bacterium]
PEILLLDEPFSALDYGLRRRLRGDLKKYQRLLGITTIFVTHHQEEALAISDRIGLMQQGTMLQVGEPAKVYQNPVNRFAAEFLGEVNLIPCTVNYQNETLDYQIHSGLGQPFSYPGSQQKLSPGEAFLMVRPEDIRLSNVTQSMFTGTVIDCEYLGPNNRLEINIGKQTLKVLTGKAGTGLQPGDQVSIYFDLAMIKFMPEKFC